MDDVDDTPGDRGPRTLPFRLGRAGGRLAMRPVRAAAHAGTEALSDEAERAVDSVFAGPLPEALGRSLVEHRVLERVAAAALDARTLDGAAEARPLDPQELEALARRLAGDPRLRQLLLDAIHSPTASELAGELTRSAAFRQVLSSVLEGPELQAALQRQTVGFGSEVAETARRRMRHRDDTVEGRVHRLLRRPAATATGRYGGVASRGLALVIDTLLAHLTFVIGGAMVGLVAALFGGLQPEALAAGVAAVGWTLVVSLYFIEFWSTTGQTPGMRLMRVRVLDASGSPPSGRWAFVRLIGLALAIIPLFAGFLPALVDRRRRALPDLLARTTVVYDDPPPDA